MLRFFWLYFILTLPLWICIISGIVVLIEEKLGLYDE